MESKILSVQGSFPSFSEFTDDHQAIFFNSFLPVLDQLSQLYLPFQSIDLIQVIWCILQIIQTTFWCYIGQYWKESKIANILSYIFYFQSCDLNEKELYILFGVFMFLVIFVLVSFLFLIVHYNKTRRIIRSLLYIVRFYFIIFGAAILHPFAALIGHFLMISINRPNASNIILLVISIIGYSISLVLFYYNQKFVNQSIYIHKSLWCTFDSTLLFFMFIWNPIFLIFSFIFSYYPIWSFVVLLVFHILVLLSFLYNYIWLPFIIDFQNGIAVSLCLSIIVNNVFRIVIEFFPSFSQSIFISVCYAFFVVFCIVFYCVFKFVKRRINNNLSYSKLLPEEDPASDQAKEQLNFKYHDLTQDEKFQYYLDLDLDQKFNKAVCYLITGFSCGSDMFIDFSLVQFLMDNYQDSPGMITHLMRILSYFKTEKNRFEIVLKNFHLVRNTTYYDKFIYLQAHRVKIQRQSTSTNISSNQLNDLKHQTNELENQMKVFWSLPAASINSIEQIERVQRKLSYLWDESIEENWSSLSFREEHIRFLVESCTDFQQAVQMINIKDKLDMLRKDRDDLCFLSLVWCFPKYLNSQIVDIDGNFLVRKNDKQHSSSSSVNQNDKLSTSSYDNDFSLEEQIANNSLSYGRLRLSMQSALNYAKPEMGKFLIIYSVASVILALLMILVTFSYFIDYFDTFDDWNKEVGVLVELRVAFVKSFLSLTILYGSKSNKFFLDEIDCDIPLGKNEHFFDNHASFDDLSLVYVEDAKEQYSNLISAILELGLKRVDISTLTELLYGISIQSYFCYFDKVIDKIGWSMEQSLNFGIMSFSILAESDDVEDWYSNNTYWCHDINTIPDVERMFSVIHNALVYDLSNSSEYTIHQTFIAMTIIGPVLFVLFLLPLPFILYFYSKEINHVIAMMLSTDQEYKEQARKNISRTVANENNDIIPPFNKHGFDTSLIIYSICIFLIVCCLLVIEELILYLSKDLSQQIRNIGFWSCYFHLLRANLFEVLVEVMNSVYYVGIQKDYLTNNDFKNRIKTIIVSIKRVITEIVSQSMDSPPIVGMDSIIDEVVLAAKCETHVTSNMHGAYECASLNQLISALQSMIKKIMEKVESFNGVFEGEELTNVYHAIFAHAVNGILDCTNRLSDTQTEDVNSFKTNLYVLFTCGIVLIVMLVFVLSFLVNNFKRLFSMCISLIRRLSPVGLISNSELTNYLLYKKGEEIEMGVTHTIFNNSFDGIICMNLDGIVEIINKSFATDYGYSTEQLVGQLIGSIFDPDSRTKLENQLKLIKNHESSNWAEHVTCYTNDGRAIPSYVTLFAIKSDENSLILVVRDETILLQKKKKLELAKKQSQDLLEQIMPPKVLMMIKEGKSEISFVVPSATVMFINIVNFSGFSADISPQQIMGTLSTLFGAFDTWIVKFPLMTRIKMIADTYMAACGLFANDLAPKTHAEESIDFALMALDILEDTNIKLNINLNIRIGINSDGPIIGGVLGTENRVFDIIGDTINVASRLEHKADPGHILMSEKTYDLIYDVGYDITPKGEVFLKGKGNMKAYLL